MSAGTRVTKMTGAGNDFVVLDHEVAAALGLGLPTWVRRVCARGLSVGADGVLVVRPLGPGRVGVDFYNPDGGVAFCGNGSRCAARYAFERGIAGSPEMVLETPVGDLPARVSGAEVRLVLPVPSDRGRCSAEVAGRTVSGHHVMAGVPHFVVFVPDAAKAPLEIWGPVLRRDSRFGPEGTNVDVVSEDANHVFHLRTWERGVEGETLACGTGAVAAAYAVRSQGRPGPVTVRPRSGRDLRIEWAGGPGAETSAILVGEARFVLEGTLADEAWDERHGSERGSTAP